MKTTLSKPRTTALLFFIAIIPLLTISQKPYEIGFKTTVKSEVLKDSREIYISLPKSYNDTLYSPRKYPVLYFFDGDTHFENLVAQRNWLTRNLYATMPEIILVGIPQKDRTNELTPTQMATPEEWKRADFSTSGGNGTFMQFIEDELKPYMQANYRTNGFEILSGHSFGGLAAISCFINTPHFFDAYIAIDPSMWWDNEILLRTMAGDWITPAHKGKILFVAKANDPGSGEEHHNGLVALNKKLEDLKENANYLWKYEYYDKEDHGSVVIPAEYDAFRFVFEGYQMPVKEVLKNPKLLDGHYQGISKKLGYTVLPNEALIDQLAKVCIRQESYKQAAQLYLKNTKLYPQSEHAKKSYHRFLKKYIHK